MFDPENPLIKEAIKKIQDEQFQPIAFDFKLGREMLVEGGNEVTKSVKDDDDVRNVQAAGRGVELAQAILHLIEEQHKIHPLTPVELAVGFQVGWCSTLTAGKSIATARLTITAADSVGRIAKTVFMMEAFSKIGGMMGRKPKS